MRRFILVLVAAVFAAVFCFAAVAHASVPLLSTVYLNGAAGNDANDGTSAATAVKTFSTAKTLLATDGTIHVTGLVTVASTQAWDLSGKGSAVVMRDSTYTTGALVSVSVGGSLTLSNIVIDGNKAQVSNAAAPIVNVSGALVMNAGALLRNNSSTTTPGGVWLQQTATSGSFVMNDGRITGNAGCTSTSLGYNMGGGVGFYAGTFTMKGGSIDANTAAFGGGIAVRSGGGVAGSMPYYLLGGSIFGNTATKGGNGLYTQSTAALAGIGPDLTLTDSVQVSGSNAFLQISGAINSNLSVSWTAGGSLSLLESQLAIQTFSDPSSPDSKYTITLADLKKITLSTVGLTGWYLKLSAASNQIQFTQTQPVWVSGVDVDKATDTIAVGQTDQLSATVAPAGATYPAVTWTSSNEAVATVDQTGLVTSVAPGSATITATTADGGYTDTCAVTAAIDLSGATIDAIPDQAYTGSAITPHTTVSLSSTTLVEDTDYTVGYENNTGVGEATFTITGMGSYMGTASTHFNIVKATPTITLAPAASSITLGDALSASDLTGGSASVGGTFAFTDPTIVPSSPGVYHASVTFTPTDTTDYETATTTVDVTVDPLDISGATIDTIADQTYTGSAITPSLAVSYGLVTLVEDTDYTVAYDNNVDVGTANVTITGIGNFKGTKATTFTIVPAIGGSVANATLSPISDKTYTGSSIRPALTVWMGGRYLTLGTDYTVAYGNNTKVGTGTATITGIGSYSGTKAVTFKIVPASISSATIAAIADQVYKGFALAPSLTVTFNGKSLKKGTSYTVAFVDNVDCGTATVTITGVGNFTGSQSATFRIIPAKAATPKPVTGVLSGTVDLTWTASGGVVTGYEVQYSTSSKGLYTSAGFFTMPWATVGSLTSGANYYFKIRAYIEIDGVKYYGAWSTASSARAK